MTVEYFTSKEEIFNNIFEQTKVATEGLIHVHKENPFTDAKGFVSVPVFKRAGKSYIVVLSLDTTNGKSLLTVRCNHPYHRVAGMSYKDYIVFDVLSENINMIVSLYIMKVLLKIPYESDTKISSEDIVECSYPNAGRQWHVRMINSNDIVNKSHPNQLAKLTGTYEPHQVQNSVST